MPGSLSHSGPARRRAHGSCGKSGAEPVHDRARLAIWVRRLNPTDASGYCSGLGFSPSAKRAAGMRRWLAVYAVGFFAFLHLPLMTLALFSFNSSRFTVWEHFSLDWYRAIFRDPQLVEATWNSIVIALLATAISTADRKSTR